MAGFRPLRLETFINNRTDTFPDLSGTGRIVILDRYFYSSIAYQGSGGANVAEVEAIVESRFPILDAVVIL